MSVLLKTHLRPLEKYFKKNVVEISINRPGEVYVEDTKGWSVHKDSELTLQTLNYLAEALATASGQTFSAETPLLATQIPEYGYRIQILGGSIVDSGFALSIRVGAARRFPINSYMDDESAESLIDAVRGRKNILVAGGTSSGKTTFLNSLMRYIQADHRIVVIEDAKELAVEQPNCVRLLKSKSGTDVGKVSYQDFINASMRLRPDRIIMGELDVSNTYPFLRLLNTGHAGGFSTVHADSPDEAIEAMCMNCQLSGLSGPVRDYATQSLDWIVHLSRVDRTTFKATVQRYGE